MLKQCHTQRGFSLIEALIAIVLVSIGLLGMAGMQMTGLRNNQTAYYRSQATILSNDILDRIRANRAVMASYAVGMGTPAGSGIVLTDLSEWKATIAAELPLGDGSVAVIGNTVTVTIKWIEDKNPADDNGVYNCDPDAAHPAKKVLCTRTQI